jgi:hypothetical protein
MAARQGYIQRGRRDFRNCSRSSVAGHRRAPRRQRHAGLGPNRSCHTCRNGASTRRTSFRSSTGPVVSNRYAGELRLVRAWPWRTRLGATLLQCCQPSYLLLEWLRAGHPDAHAARTDLAIGVAMSGGSWQRCRSHWGTNFMAVTPIRRESGCGHCWRAPIIRPKPTRCPPPQFNRSWKPWSASSRRRRAPGRTRTAS